MSDLRFKLARWQADPHPLSLKIVKRKRKKRWLWLIWILSSHSRVGLRSVLSRYKLIYVNAVGCFCYFFYCASMWGKNHEIPSTCCRAWQEISNPQTGPAWISLHTHTHTLWLDSEGAEALLWDAGWDSVKRIFSAKIVLFMHHLLKVQCPWRQEAFLIIKWIKVDFKETDFEGISSFMCVYQMIVMYFQLTRNVCFYLLRTLSSNLLLSMFS